jgi:heme-degrading monooxygenase HmoA
MRPGSWDLLEERYRELAKVPVPGRLARWVTQDVNDPESVIMVTLWDSEESVKAWEASPQHDRAVRSVQPFLIGSQTVSLCEVRLEDPPNLLANVRAQARRSS